MMWRDGAGTGGGLRSVTGVRGCGSMVGFRSTSIRGQAVAEWFVPCTLRLGWRFGAGGVIGIAGRR